MHPVADLIHRRLRGEKDDAKLAIVAEASGQKWVVLIGMAARLEAHGITAEIFGGTSGGALIMLYLAQQQAALGALNVNHLSRRGYEGNSHRQFIHLNHLFKLKPIMDIDGSIDEVLTNYVPLHWAGFKTMQANFFVTTTQDDGTAVVRRLDGQPIKTCKDYAKTTARIPFIGGWPHAHTEWDGGFTHPLPLQPAIALGATHTLALRCKTDSLNLIEHFLLQPMLKFTKPHLAKRLKQVASERQKTETLAYSHQNTLMIEVPKLKLSSACVDETRMMLGVLQGWHAAGETLHLPPLPYPALWRPTMERLGLAQGAEFA